MLTLNDGRAELWQWDTGRTLAVDADCSQVHFSNKVFGRSVDVDVTDSVAIIPDILLQTDNDLNVFAFVGTAENGYTKISKTFKVNRRNKPADYVFTPTDQMTLQMIQRQIGDLSDLTTEAKDTLVAAINEAARTGGGAGSMDLRVADGYVQYSTDGGSTWANLIDMADLKGDPGAPGIYYGTTQPTGDTHPVWINPDGGPDDGGLLPAVTAADNGKVLRVVNSAWAAEKMPTALPNPNALTFTGAVTGSYDGSAPLSVEIPSGGGSGSDISLGLTGAAVGQIAKITAVDASGVPTAWAPVDMPGGGDGETWEEIKVITLADAVNTVTINTDSGGNSISLKKVRILIEGSATAQLDLFFNNSRYMRSQVVGTAASVGALSAEPFCGKMYCFAVTNIIANYASTAQPATIFSGEIKITEIKIIVNNSGTFSAGTKFTIQGVRA